MLDDRDYMARALGEARDAGDRGEVPVGAVLVGPGGDILASAGNAQIGIAHVIRQNHNDVRSFSSQYGRPQQQRTSEK